MTAAFNPHQARDKRGRWIEMGATVSFSTGFGGSGPKKTGIVTGYSNDGSGTFVKETGTGQTYMPASREIEVLDVQARLPASRDEKHPEVQKREAANAAQAESSPVKEMADSNGETVKVGEEVAWKRDRKALPDDTFARGGTGKVVTMREDGSFVIKDKWDGEWEVPAGKGSLTKIQPDAELDKDGQALLDQLKESAKWAGYGNDGYDKAASGRENAFNEAAKLVQKKGATPEVAAELRKRAESAKGKADSQSATTDYYSYNPFDAGSADGYSQAADMVEKLTGGSSVDTPDAPADNATPALPELTDQEFKVHTEAVERSIDKALKAGLATDAQFSLDGKGEVWDPERAKLHNEIVNEMWAKAANVPNEGKGLFSGGLGGAGKTTTLGNPATGIDQSQYLIINPDDIKEILAAKGMVPEVPDSEVDLSPMEKVALIHEESSHIANLLAQRAYAEKKNVTWDITMASEGSVAKRIAEMKAKGYGELQAVFVDIPVEKSVERAMGRYKRGMELRRNGVGDGGRYVPPSVIRKNVSTSFSSANRMNFEALRDQFDNWQVWDNSVDGRQARQVYSKMSTDLARLTEEARAGKTDNDREAVAP